MRAHIRWTGRGSLELLDQRLLPSEVVFRECRTAAEVATAIRDMVVRGAPAIGISAAYGMALAARAASVSCANRRDFRRQMNSEAEVLASARPTAVNLRWAVDRLLRLATDLAKSGADPEDVAASVEEEAIQIHRDDVNACKSIGKVGAAFVPKKASILTHCNAGALATGGFGTALGVIRAAREAGKAPRVFADETRPFLQGARLTAWELMEDNIPVTVICESAAASLLASGRIDLVLVGADRIAANGDTANKVGTYPLAVLAHRHGVPFYVAAPLSTFDPDLPDGSGIPIELRPSQEILRWGEQAVAPPGAEAFNPAFDVTPHDLITALFTEAGAVKPVDAGTVGDLLGRLRP
ncbi:MAG: S-methyl-5-thioribose-1-phosphate isomerase [Acidobacteriota bacterium]